MAIFTTMGIILLVVSILLFGLIFFWYKRGIVKRRKKDEGEEKKKEEAEEKKELDDSSDSSGLPERDRSEDDEEENGDDEEAEEDPKICIYCGSMEKIHKGHLMAPSKGGQKTVSACEKCNTSKGKKALMDWLRWVKENREERWETIVGHNKGKRTRVAHKIHKVRDEGPGSECIYCGSTENVQEGHIIAPSKGGQKPVSACEKCNTSKGKKALMDWLRWVKENRGEQWEQMVKANEGKRSEVARKIHKIRDEKDKKKQDSSKKVCLTCGQMISAKNSICPHCQSKTYKKKKKEPTEY